MNLVPSRLARQALAFHVALLLALLALAGSAQSYDGRFFTANTYVNDVPIDYDILYQTHRAEKVSGTGTGEAPAEVVWKIVRNGGMAGTFRHIVVTQQTCPDPVPECRETLLHEEGVPGPSFAYTFEEPGSYFVWVAYEFGRKGFQSDTTIIVEEGCKLPSCDTPGQGDEKRSEKATEALARHCDNGKAGQHSKHCR